MQQLFWNQFFTLLFCDVDRTNEKRCVKKGFEALGDIYPIPLCGSSKKTLTIQAPHLACRKAPNGLNICGGLLVDSVSHVGLQTVRNSGVKDNTIHSLLLSPQTTVSKVTFFFSGFLFYCVFYCVKCISQCRPVAANSSFNL